MHLLARTVIYPKQSSATLSSVVTCAMDRSTAYYRRASVGIQVTVIHGLRAVPAPDEILEAILSELSKSKDKSSLKSCTMVCRQWARVAYPLRFRQISHVFTELLDQYGALSVEWHSIESLVQDLQSMPQVASSIQELTLRAGYQRGDLEVNKLASLLALLPSLRTLDLSHMFILPPEDLNNPSIPQPLQTMQFQESTFTSASLVYILGLFSVVHSLIFYDCTALPHSEEEVNFIPPSVDALALRSSGWAAQGTQDCISVLTHALGSADSPTCLRSLDLFTSPDLDAKGYNVLLQSLGHNLKTLTLAISYSQTVGGHVDLSLSPHLETLRLMVNFPYGDPEDAAFNEIFATHTWPSISTIVTTATPSLRDLDINLQLELDWRSELRSPFSSFDISHVCGKLARLDWTALERAVAGLHTLRELHVGLKRYDWHNQEIDSVEAVKAEKVLRDECLWSLRTRSLLRFTIEDRVPDFPHEIVR